MTTNGTGRLVVLGMKVGDPASIERWAAEGHLPVIRSIMERGCHGRLAGRERICEHGSATTVLSGVPADRHGYYYFRQLVPGSYRLAPFGAGQVDARPFWARPDVFSGSVAVIDAPETAPAAGVKGHQLVNWCFHQADLNIAPHASEPPELLDEVRRRFGEPPDILGDTANGTPDEDRRDLDRFLRSVRTKGELCRHVVSLGEPDLVIAAFDESHTASHRYWRYRPEAANGGAQDEALRNAIRSVYQAIDREFGLLLEQVGEGANVVLFTLFGMQDQYPTEGLNESLCRALGYQARKGARPGRPRAIDVARRVIPESWRSALSKRLSGGRQEALLADLFASGTDWERTRAFSLPSLYTGFIRVNLCGREPAGIVEPEDYGKVLDGLESDLRRLEDAETGEPVIDSVIRTVEALGGGPPERLPDLFVEWKAGPRLLERVRHPRGELGQRRPSFCPGSEETLEGFVAAAGPDVGGRGGIGDIASVDFAPTLLALLGTPVPPDMPGRPHASLLDAARPSQVLR
ncbi:MAG: alkaline phosphatase family protein [Gemmatimonadota bacterium]